MMFNQCSYGRLRELVTVAALFRALRSVAMAKQKTENGRFFKDDPRDLMFCWPVSPPAYFSRRDERQTFERKIE